jgi:hypothetical protein
MIFSTLTFACLAEGLRLEMGIGAPKDEAKDDSSRSSAAGIGGSGDGGAPEAGVNDADNQKLFSQQRLVSDYAHEKRTASADCSYWTMRTHVCGALRIKRRTTDTSLLGFQEHLQSVITDFVISIQKYKDVDGPEFTGAPPPHLAATAATARGAESTARVTTASFAKQLAESEEYLGSLSASLTEKKEKRDWINTSRRYQCNVSQRESDQGKRSEIETMARRCMCETKVNYRTGESLDIRSVDLFIGIESREEPERPKKKGLTR